MSSVASSSSSSSSSPSSTAAVASSSSSSSSSSSPATRYHFCHGCFFAIILTADAACPLCHGAFVEEINIRPPHAPNPNRSIYITTGCLFSSPASFVLRCRADADAFFHSEISPLGHLMRYPARRPPFPLACLEARIDDLLTRSARAYVILAGLLPTSNHDIDSEARQIALDANEHSDIFISPAARWAVSTPRDIEIDTGPNGGASCMVCLETLAVGAAVKRFPCKHVFHTECIFEWLRQQHTCPVCRFPLLTEEVGGPSYAVVFRVFIPPLPLGLNLDEKIVVLHSKKRGKPQIPPRQWA